MDTTSNKQGVLFIFEMITRPVGDWWASGGRTPREATPTFCNFMFNVRTRLIAVWIRDLTVFYQDSPALLGVVRGVCLFYTNAILQLRK